MRKPDESLKVNIDVKVDNKFKAGTYIVGDLCYLPWDDINSKLWDQICDEFVLNDENYAVIEGSKLFVNHTAYGDGEYEIFNGSDSYFIRVNNGETIDALPVDAGILSIIDIKILEFFDITFEDFIKDNSDSLAIVDFKDDFTCMYSNGIFYFGELVIDTEREETDY